jgi:hypothetical protein
MEPTIKTENKGKKIKYFGLMIQVPFEKCINGLDFEKKFKSLHPRLQTLLGYV